MPQTLTFFETFQRADWASVSVPFILRNGGVYGHPVDVKVRANMAPDRGTKIIGYDAAGVVRQVGDDVSKFKVDDQVYYAGDLTRPGTNSELPMPLMSGSSGKSRNFSATPKQPVFR